MVANLRARVARLEIRDIGGLQKIFVTGGLDDDAINVRAFGGGRSWSRDNGETPVEFQARVEREARALRLRTVVFGGLPDWQ